jgi:hypothetical protein
MANELRTHSGLDFVAPQPVHCKTEAWLKSASAPTVSDNRKNLEGNPP